MTLNDLVEHVMQLCPSVSVSEDNDGQIILNTNLKVSPNSTTYENEELVPFEAE